MKKLDIYIAGSVILLCGVYLHSSAVAISAVILWGIHVAENILTKSAKDAEIVELRSELAKLQKEHKSLSMEITNVAERAKTVLGEVY